MNDWAGRTPPSKFDNEQMHKARMFIDNARNHFIENYVKANDVVLDIGNQNKYPPKAKFTLLNCDIVDTYKPDLILDITKHNPIVSDHFFDHILCLEVLEHVVDPFSAIKELRRILRVGGSILVTTPLNARIHGPIPDCWRFTEFGLKVLFRDFRILKFQKLDTPDRNLFPLHYSLIAQQETYDSSESDPRKLKFSHVT
jgi:SAM-dependent methyltransferase